MSKKAGKPGKGRFAASLAVRTSKAKRHSPRVVLAFPGGSRRPFESGEIAGMARRAVTLGEFLAPGAGVEPWIYTARTHRLPQLLPANAAEWIEDWAVVPPKSLLTRDAPPDNQLLANTKRFGLFGFDDEAEAVRAIAASLPKDGAPTLVLFHVWAPGDDGTPSPTSWRRRPVRTSSGSSSATRTRGMCSGTSTNSGPRRRTSRT